MTTLLAGAVLALAQGPYSFAPPGEAPVDAPVWTAEQAAEEHVFRVTARFECPPGTVGGLVQVSISDTMARAELGGEENTGRRVLTLRVPGKQLQGLNPRLFCPQPPGAAQQVLRLRSKFTAQGALICRNAESKNIPAQASTALDAWLICPSAKTDAPKAPERTPNSSAG